MPENFEKFNINTDKEEQTKGPEQQEAKIETNLPEIQEEVFVPKISEAEKIEIKAEDEQPLETEKSILEAADNPEFIKRIFPEAPEKIDAEVLDRALETLLNADGVELSRAERMQLFQTTLEYYSSPSEVEVPLLHSTSSFSLLNAINGEGLRGGFGEVTGEFPNLDENKDRKTQDDLSVSHPYTAEHPEYLSFETLQQVYARAGAKKEELGKYLSIDSEKITGQSLVEVLVKELFSSLDKNQLKKFTAKRLGKWRLEDVTAEEVERENSKEVQKAFIEKFKKYNTHPLGKSLKWACCRVYQMRS